MLTRILNYLASHFSRPSDYPVPGKDAQWIGWCKCCDPGADDPQLLVSRGGFQPGSKAHCYGCGHEAVIDWTNKPEDFERMIISSWAHWQKHAVLPYFWHELDEPTKFIVLYGGKQWKPVRSKCTPSSFST